jgi:ABC-2 type transport system permease protein
MFRIALQGIRDYYRDGSALFFGLIFPIVMVASLGNLLADMDNPDYSIGEIKIGYYAQADGESDSRTDGEANARTNGESDAQTDDEANSQTNDETTQAAAVFVNALGQIDGIKLIEEKSEAAAKKSVTNKDADVAMVFTGNTNVKVYEGGDNIKNRTASMIAKGFVRESAAYTAAYEAVAAEDPQKIQGLTDRLAARTADGDALTTDRKFDGRTQSMLDFYAVTMIIMICFMGGGIGGASGMYFARREGLLRRIAASPRRSISIFFENIIVYVPVNIVQTLAIMLPATLLFGAHYAAAPADNILLFAFSVLLGTTVGAVCMLIGLFMKSNPYIPFMAVMWTLLFISGSFNKEILIPGVSEYLPMNIMNRAAFDLTLFGQSGPMLTLIVILAVILAASCLAGSLVIRRKEKAL